ncbi:MAG TPA: hypothetical protein VD994_04950 [Prosthecobacter sp.]|nr:hypothetical protein [Prosthecobacter sp.]
MNATQLRLKTLAKANPAPLAAWLRQPLALRSVMPLLLCVCVGGGAYGFSIGLWRAPLQGVFVAVKMPCLIFLTLFVNGLLNGLLAALLGSGLSFRQTLMACLMSFAIFGLIVGSLSPIAIAMALDAPPPGAVEAARWYRVILLTHTAIIAFAGVVANGKLLRLLQDFAGSSAAGWRVLLAWLAGNLFVGAQLSYNLRPFFGNPELPVQFVRPDPFHGNFYEAVWTLLLGSLPTSEIALGVLRASLFAAVCAVLVFFLRKRARRSPKSTPATP